MVRQPFREAVVVVHDQQAAGKRRVSVGWHWGVGDRIFDRINHSSRWVGGRIADRFLPITNLLHRAPIVDGSVYIETTLQVEGAEQRDHKEQGRYAGQDGAARACPYPC